MRILRPAAALALSIAAAANVAAVQHIVPRLPPPKTSIYDFLDLGPAPAVPCTCVPNPFARPAYVPLSGHGASGSALPFEPPPISDADRETNKAWYVQESKDLGLMAASGRGGNPNDSLAIANHLSLYKTVVGPDDKVEAEAVRWLTLAAQQGHHDAFRLLGQRYAHGWGVKQDDVTAASWFHEGARRGDPISMAAIGFLFAAGRGVPQDWDAAISWWQRAGMRAPLVPRFLGDAYACGAGVAQDSDRAIATYKQADEPSSGIQLGHMYRRGCPVKNDDAAVAAFRGAADQGFPDAQIELSAMLLEGRGTEPNSLEAYRWARVAEWRLPACDLKKRAADLAASAARAWPDPVIASEDRMIKHMLESAAQSRR